MTDDRRRTARYDSYSDSSVSPPRRRKSLGEQALAALGVGGAAAALGGRERSRSRHRSRRSRSYSSSPDDRRRGHSRARSQDRIVQAGKAALTAAAAEAFRARKEPGGWTGEKGKRIITAALASGGADTLLDKNGNKHGTRHVIESAVAGLATNRLVNGPRSQSRGPGGRSRSRGGRARSQSRGGLKDIAAGGAVAAIGKQIYDRVRSKSRGRHSRSSSVSSYSDDSRDRSRGPRRNKKRSNSVVAAVTSGMAALGLKKASDRRRRDSSASSSDSYRSGRRGGYSGSREVGRPRDGNSAPQSKAGSGGGGRGGKGSSSGSSSDSDLGDSSEEERKLKKMRGKEFLTAGLATVATIHAAHNIYSSMEARDVRHRKLVEGEISPEKARQEKSKAQMKDLASIGLAALGIKGAVGEWKEMNEKRHEMHEMRQISERHRQKRQRKRQQSKSHNGSSYGNGSDYQRRSGSAPDLHSGGTYYQDGNPYGSGGSGLPPPPAGPGPQARY